MKITATLFVLAAVAACTAVSLPSPTPRPVLASDATAAILAAPAGLRAATIGPNRYGEFGRYRITTSACRRQDRGGAPIVLPDRTRPPTVGRPTTVQWQAELLQPRTPVAALLLVSFGDVAPVPLGEAGWPGCVMQVDPNPRNLFAITPAPGSILTQIGPRLLLDWTPPAAFAGLEVNVQAMFAVPGSSNTGWLWSPGLEMWIGG